MWIRQATLWDGTGAPPQRNAALHCEGERIVWIGPEPQAPVPASDELVVDAGGRWVMPGLIDLHVHLTADPSQSDFLLFLNRTPIPEQALLGAHHARLMLEAGFTATRDLGAMGYTNVALKRAVEAGWIPGPRIAACGSFLSVPGGHGDAVMRPEVVLPAQHIISGPDEARRAVREQVKRGAEWIKLLVTGGVMSGGTALGAALWEEDELDAALQMARRLGAPVAAHCHGAAGIIAAAEAGVRTVEHGTMGDEESAAVMRRHDTVLVPTFVAAGGVVREAQAGRLPAAIATQALQIAPKHRTAFSAALAAGVRVAMGTDTGVPGTRFGQNAQELGLMVDHGLTPEAALLAGTRDAAAVLGWSDRLGTLESGKLADLLLVDGDPLSDVTHLASLERIHLVVKGGAIATDRRPEHR